MSDRQTDQQLNRLLVGHQDKHRIRSDAFTDSKSASVSLFVCESVSVCLSCWLAMSLLVCLLACLSVDLSGSLPVSLPRWLAAWSFVCLLICLCHFIRQQYIQAHHQDCQYDSSAFFKRQKIKTHQVRAASPFPVVARKNINAHPLLPHSRELPFLPFSCVSHTVGRGNSG